jgi:hypothetical protein
MIIRPSDIFQEDCREVLSKFVHWALSLDISPSRPGSSDLHQNTHRDEFDDLRFVILNGLHGEAHNDQSSRRTFE